MKTSTPTFVSLYAGAGGMDIGFTRAGFAPVWTNEIDRAAVQTYNAAFKRLANELDHLDGIPHEAIAESIDSKSVRIPGEGAADIVIGGPPCQGFSVAGQMDPNDPRSRHVHRFLDVVESVRPKAFVMENVKSLYESRRWAALRELLAERASWLGYDSAFFLAKASHFEVPQARERMFFIGVQGSPPPFPETVTENFEPTVRDGLATLPAWGDAGNDSLCRAKITLARKPVMRKSPWAGMMFNGAGRPLNLDRPALTLPASMGGNKTPIIDQDSLETEAEPWVVKYHERLWNGGTPLVRVPSRLRRLSVEEAAALQSFPVGMDWRGQQSSRFRQIGNAVPPQLAFHVAAAVKQAIS